MGAVQTLPFARPLTYADLATMPDDGHRYELVDGTLVVSPSPVPVHQRVVTRLVVLLTSNCPAEYEVLPGPLDVVLADDTVLVPDLVVARRSQLSARNLPAAPVLAVEVLSPSTRRFDLMVKHSRLEAAGAEHYWVVDAGEPSVVAWQHVDGRYVQAGRSSGDAQLRLDRPWAVALTPAALVAEHG